MTTNKITDSEIESLKVGSLPTRPTAPTAFGGRGYTVKSNMTQSSLRIFDGGAGKAHFDASIHAVRAYLK